MEIHYLVMPFIAWLTAGVTKFVINSISAKKPAFNQIGYGGMPSNHSCIVSSVATLIALREGINHPAFAVALTLAFIVLLDASSLRRQVGLHAERLNQLAESDKKSLRERMGHSKPEIITGVLLGVLLGWLVNALLI